MSIFSLASTTKRIVNNVFRATRCDDDGYTQVTNKPDDFFNTLPQDRKEPIVNHYLHAEEATPTLSGTQSLGSLTITLTPTADIDIGDAITIKEGDQRYQSIVKAKDASSVTVVSPLTYAFTVAASVSAGSWNLNKNGSITPVSFELTSVSGVTMHLTKISINLIDNSVMDSSKFGSLAALANGMVLRHENSRTCNLALLINNSGFSEQGFSTIYDEKPPSGVYSVRHTMIIPDIYGSVLEVTGDPSDKLILRIQDDLSAMDNVVCNLGGHIITA